MRRLQEKVQVFKRNVRGEITVFLSLIFILLLSLVGALIESASIRMTRNHRRATLSLAVESVFAEYHTKLLEEYHIFAIDGSYGSGHFSTENILGRLKYYGADALENKVTGFSLLTDNGGKEFYRMAVQYEADVTGIGEVLKKEDIDSWEDSKAQKEQYEKETNQVIEEIDGKLATAGESLPAEGNPIRFLSDWKRQGALSLLISDVSKVSDKKIDGSVLPSGRENRKGIGQIKNSGMVDEPLGKALFCSYVKNHFSCFTEEKEDRKICYEREYLLFGNADEKANLEQALSKMISLRFVGNYGYLLTDTAKMEEAEVMAAGLCTLLTVPEITSLVKHAILLAWAYGESIMDVRLLAKGEKVETVKTKDSWRLALSGLANLGSDTSVGEGAQKGLSYEDYLQILLLLEGKETMSMRALDLVEQELELAMDGCVTGMNIKSICNLRRGLSYEFETTFSYE